MWSLLCWTSYHPKAAILPCWKGEHCEVKRYLHCSIIISCTWCHAWGSLDFDIKNTWLAAFITPTRKVSSYSGEDSIMQNLNSGYDMSNMPLHMRSYNRKVNLEGCPLINLNQNHHDCESNMARFFYVTGRRPSFTWLGYVIKVSGCQGTITEDSWRRYAGEIRGGCCTCTIDQGC